MIRRLLFEPGVDDLDPIIEPFARNLAEFAVFNGCDRIVIETAEPRRRLRWARENLACSAKLSCHSSRA